MLGRSQKGVKRDEVLSIRMYLVNARQSSVFTYRVALEMGYHQHYNRIENGAIGEAIQFKTIVSLAYALNIPVQSSGKRKKNIKHP